MNRGEVMSLHLTRLFVALLLKPRPARTERGDVPGWVLITVMTAGLVTALWVVAEPQLRSFFESAISAVHGP